MAVSGIDHTIKIFSPDTRLQRNARKGIGVQSANPSGFSSLNWGRRRHAQVPRDEDEDDEEESAASSDTESGGEDEGGADGLKSRKRMHKSYEITSKNDMERKGGREDYFISSAVFAHLARHFAAAQQEGADEGGTQPIVISDDNCATM
jgi:DDB1- and CUL4-associated factor 6